MRWFLAALALLGTDAGAFTPEERAVIDRHRVLLEASPDPCRIAARAEAEYKRILSSAPGPDAAEALAALDGKPPIPLVLGEGVRISEGFALYDADRATIYLSSPSVAPRLLGRDGACPSDAALRAFAFGTVGVYLHEATHAFERRDLGPSVVTTLEGELLAYARESRFLAALPGWPPKEVAAELEMRAAYREQVAVNRELIGWVEELKGEEPSEESLDKLTRYVALLEENRRLLERIAAVRTGADPLVADIAEMVAAWRAGYPAFLSFALRRLEGRPSLAQREEVLAFSRRYLADSRKAAAAEEPGSLHRAVAEHSVRLAEKDLAFWGDERAVAKAADHYRSAFQAVRPPAKTKAP